jgi:CheY-like chemotaxis protein
MRQLSVSAKTILIIDDERDIQRALKVMLSGAGYSVHSALDAMQGPMMARQVKPDLIVLDINMPGGGGSRVYDVLRMNSNFLGTPILIYTVVPLAEVRKRIPEHSNTAFLAKPAQPEEILGAVQKLLAEA